MLRQLLLAAIIGSLTTPLLAQDPVLQLVDEEVSAPVPASPSKNADPIEQMMFSFDLDLEETPQGEALPLGDSSPPSDEIDFHSVCGCDCHVPPLDHWCEYCGPGCTTSCWVDHPCHCSQGNCYLTEDGEWVSNDAWCDVWGTPVYRPYSALRFGWWGVDADGSPTKIGEYQDLESSPFWDVDTISSDGVRTWDFALSGLDNETSDARVRLYGPHAAAKIDYQRYPRRLEHDPLTGYDLDNPVPPGPDDNVVSEDLNVGEDYAIRIQELDARFKGRLADNLKWRMNLWSQRKFGQRQTNAVAHCFNINDPAPAGANGNTCHVLSQSQTIDWLTTEIQPALEAEFENVSVEYSHTMRSFGQSDELVTRQYTRFGFNAPAASGFLGPEYDYALVPENLTQIDRLKVDATLTETNQLYANLYVGGTENQFRGTHRDMNGYDLRLTNRTLDQITLTGYASRYEEDNELPLTFLTAPPLSPVGTYDEDSLRHPLDYTRTCAGIKGSWRPYGNRHSYCSYGLWDGTSLAAGYEYYQLEREFAVYNTTPVPPGPFAQPDTITNQIEFGPSTRWSRALDTYTRYRVRFIDVPLIGVSEYSEEDTEIQGTFNSSLPEQTHAVELGSTWTPTDNFMTTAQFTIENSWQDSQFANFTENNYPFVFTAWYAPTQRWSLTSGYAYFSNWIDQDITLGANRGNPNDTETTRWDYAGENHLVSFSAAYAWTECVQLVGGYEWNRGSNVFSVPLSPAGADWSLLPFLSDVLVETQRLTAGVDWQPQQHMDVYFRYILFDYDDLSAGRDSGISHMALAGAGAIW